MLCNSRPLKRVRALIFWVLLTAWLSLPLIAQQVPAPEALPVLGTPGLLAGLQLEPSRSAELESALNRRDYKRAETILVEEAQRDPKSARTAKLYTVVGHILFLDGQYLNSAIAWKKAEAIASLDDQSRFSLAMAYLRLNRPDWGRDELQRLSQIDPHNPLYLYWLAKLDYDARAYSPAISRLRRVLELDPNMMRAYNNLGLCYDSLGQFDEAIQNFTRAVELNRKQQQPSAWPPLNLAVSLISVNRLDEAAARLREALSYNPKFPQAHYQLGLVLEKEGRFEEAIAPLQRAIELDPSYPEPHYTLGRIYQRQGKREEAQEQIEKFKKLKKEPSPLQSPASNPITPPAGIPLQHRPLP
ncbi:MAG TPA: tetratricopeptide repeat protein [Candidatus Sulfotelmatobacter sp.]|nr:tetratricopeptide repeat protein [Candidatus Sulfotelmatobacter sp.]